jgi:O-methyltransferase
MMDGDMTLSRKTPPLRFDLDDALAQRFFALYDRVRDLTMIPRRRYVENLMLMHQIGRAIPGAFVECGTWKGGMSVGMIDAGGTERDYRFLDSFEGLPDAKEEDGPDAKIYQDSPDDPLYYDNCTAGYEPYVELMRAQPIAQERIKIYRGWFKDTLPQVPKETISVLRLDGDWYESTLECLTALYDLVPPGGIIILDDYDRWDGCARATHEFLARTGSTARIRRTNNEYVSYLLKFD